MNAEVEIENVVTPTGRERSAQGRLLKSSAILTSGRLLVYSLSFTRNLILVRMLTKADYGLAAVFGLTISLLEVAGRMAFGQQVIQNRDGDSDAFLATSQAFQLITGTCGAVLIAALSIPLARLFNAPHCWPYFALLACVPLFKAFEHLDVFRQQRELKFLPAAIVEVVPQVVVTAAAWPLVLWLKDYRAIVWLMAGNASLSMLMTHLAAERPYRCGWHQEHGRRMFIFAWPLLLNGLVMFLCQEADQILVVKRLSFSALAEYNLALTLVSIPWFIFAQTGSSLMLPILSRSQDDCERFRAAYRECVTYAAMASVFLLLPMIVAGEQIAAILYGNKYAGVGPVIALLGAASAVRFVRFTPAIAAMARADTLNQLYANLWRAVSLPLAIGVIVTVGCNVVLVAGCALAAEVAASLFSIYRLRQRQGIPLRDHLAACVFIGGFLLAGLGIAYAGVGGWSAWAACAVAVLILVAALVTSLIVFPNAWTALGRAAGWTWRGKAEPAA